MAAYGTFSEESDIEAAPLLNQSNQSEDPCAICIEDLRNISVTNLKPCEHRFCKKCIRTLSRHAEFEEIPVTCPLCRVEVQNWPELTCERVLNRLQSCFCAHSDKLFFVLTLCLFGFVVYAIYHFYHLCDSAQHTHIAGCGKH